MPLIKGKGKKAFEGNIKAEMHAGKPQDQALAIAYSMKKKAKKMAEGGQIKDNEQSPAHEEDMLHAREAEAPPAGYMEPEMGSRKERAMAAFHGKPQLRASGNKDYQSEMPDQGHTVTLTLNPQAQYDPKEEPAPEHNGPAMSEDDRDLNQHGEDETGPMGAYADGGDVSPAEKMEQMKQGAQNVLGKDNPPAHDVSSAWQNIKDAFKSPQETMAGHAEGGFITDNKQDDSHEMDMVERIMKKRQMCYSKGGQVANEDQGESASVPDRMAKDDPNEFDDLALRDDLEFSDTGASSGDEDGSKLNQEDNGSEDMIDRIMKKRSSKK